MRPLGVAPLLLSLTAVAMACRHAAKVDYSHANGAADARRAFMDSGHFHVLAVRVGDSVISPSDTTAYKQRSINVEVGPEGPIVYLPVTSDPARPRWPSSAQLSYIKAYNTELFALLDTNLMHAQPSASWGVAVMAFEASSSQLQPQADTARAHVVSVLRASGIRLVNRPPRKADLDQLVPARFAVVGTVTATGDSIRLDAKLISVETTATLRRVSLTGPVRGAAALGEMLGRIVSLDIKVAGP